MIVKEKFLKVRNDSPVWGLFCQKEIILYFCFSKMKQVLFVCLGNICRSPSAEAVFNELIRKNGFGSELQCDSAGTAAYHAGDQAHYRMKQYAQKRGYRLTSISRPVDRESDFDRFDYIIGMDRQNIRDLKAMARNENDRKKIFLMTDFCPNSEYD